MQNKKYIVNKFGGGILRGHLMPFMEARIREEINRGFLPVAVVSALPGVTDELLSVLGNIEKTNSAKFIKNLFNKHLATMQEIGMKETKLAEKELGVVLAYLEKDLAQYNKFASVALEDKVVAYGEKLSAVLFTHFLKSLNLESSLLPAEEIPILTDENHKNANIIFKTSEKNLQNKFKSIAGIVVIPGFTGITKAGDITTLGRGGTDTTACFVGASLRAEKVILWKDVEGVMSANPKIVKKAKTVPFISYQEAEEAGKIIHDKAIQYVKIYDTPIEVALITDPKQKTVVGPAKKLKHGTKIVSYKKDLVLFTITDESKKENSLLSISSNAFFKHKVDIILISNTQYSIQIVADPSTSSGQAVQKITQELANKISQVESHPVSMIYLIGSFDVYDVNDFNAMLIKMKADLEISAFLYKNCTRLEAIIKEQNIDKIINALHKKFIK